MIIFKKITAKNFLSYGNVPTSVELNKYKNVLIVGENGSGKSVLFSDAICFVLYGKPYRSINKGQLLNSINQKGLEVEIEFSTGSSDFRVLRGIRPGIFEIYKDGVLVDQEAAKKDYQGYLEKHVLKVNFKTFCQVVILGTASFVPFMKLNAGQRREVIEDVLDIAIFSEMNNLLKHRILETREETNLVAVRIESSKKEATAQQKLIRVIEEAKESRILEEQSAIENIKQRRSILNVSIADQKLKIVNLKRTSPTPVDEVALRTAQRTVDRLEDEIQRSVKQAKSVASLEECQTCLQGVSADHKSHIKKIVESTISGTRDKLDAAKSALADIEALSDVYGVYKNEVTLLTTELNSLNESLQVMDRSIEERYELIQTIQKNNSNVADEKKKLKDLAEKAIGLLNRKSELLEEKNLQDVSLTLLKDSGIKAEIIKEYIPIINKLINKYLGVFGFFVNFNLDENFVETIRSRGRDEFSYDSFSEGEKRKIDLAILFSFRQIAELKNSANCNLLVCDEIGESAFDLIARDAFMEILNSLEGGNNFVISHTAPSHESYDAVIKVEKKNDFSVFNYLT
jgi:DNA repair exonuclease SbcCD ATPase subunit